MAGVRKRRRDRSCLGYGADSNVGWHALTMDGKGVKSNARLACAAVTAYNSTDTNHRSENRSRLCRNARRHTPIIDLAATVLAAVEPARISVDFAVGRI